MFTGIIEETGILMSVKGGLSGSRLAVKADRVLEDIQKRRQHCRQRRLPYRIFL